MDHLLTCKYKILCLCFVIIFLKHYEHKKMKRSVPKGQTKLYGSLAGNGHQFESPQGHWRFTRSLTSGSCGISRGARKLARTSTVIKKKKMVPSWQRPDQFLELVLVSGHWICCSCRFQQDVVAKTLNRHGFV